MTPPTKADYGKTLVISHESRGPIEGLLRYVTSTAMCVMIDGFPDLIALDEVEHWEFIEKPYYEELQSGIDKLESGEPLSTEERMALLAHIEQLEAREKRYKEAEEAMFPPK